ncbi:MAG: acyl-CoA thioesterase [Planctomycetes bacterium]|nr:acyl-CoA thioesterase [Planctomycetota bacterium]
MISESTLLVRPEHLNHHGSLFGGRLLEWLDEQAYIAAITRLDYRANLVTVAIDDVEFHEQVHKGSVLRFRSLLVHVGRTSLTVHTEVARMPSEQKIFEAYVTFVALDKKDRPTLVGKLLLKPFTAKTADEKRHWRKVESERSRRRAKTSQK